MTQQNVKRRTMDEVLESWKAAGYLPQSARLDQLARRHSRRRIPAILALVVLSIVLFNSISPRIVLTGKPLTKADVLLVDSSGESTAAPESLTTILKDVGLSWVEYDSLGIDSLREIPSGGYRLIIIKAHSGPNILASSEPYSLLGHAFEQITDRVGRFRVEGKDYFSILPEFVKTMDGKFDGTMILLMGCNTLTSGDLAKAFLGKGASVVIGWKGLITPSLADLATLVLLQEVLKGHKATSSAVSNTMNLLGPYLGAGDELTSYPV